MHFVPPWYYRRIDNARCAGPKPVASLLELTCLDEMGHIWYHMTAYDYTNGFFKAIFEFASRTSYAQF